MTGLFNCTLTRSTPPTKKASRLRRRDKGWNRPSAKPLRRFPLIAHSVSASGALTLRRGPSRAKAERPTAGYVVLSAAERAKGFVKPVRRHTFT